VNHRGGKREGAGRPRGTGKFGETTQAIRVPKRMVDVILEFVDHEGYTLPLYGTKVSAGFPSPADDFLEGSLNLSEYLIKNPPATFFVRVTGDSMINAGLFPNDILVVDRSLPANDNKIVIAALNGELTVKRLKKKDGQVFLMPENPNYKPIKVMEHQDLQIWGVVTNVIHAV